MRTESRKNNTEIKTENPNVRLINKMTSEVALQQELKTFEPTDSVPSEYCNIIKKYTMKFYNNYVTPYINSDIAKTDSNVYTLIHNRAKNLVIEGIQNGTVTTPEDAFKLLYERLLPTPKEEVAVIGACKNKVPTSGDYVFAFLSHKVYSCLKKNNFLNHNHIEEIYTELQIYLFTLVEEYNPANEKLLAKNSGGYAGLVYSYCERAMLNYYAEVIIPQYSLVKMSRNIYSQYRKVVSIKNQNTATEYDRYIEERDKDNLGTAQLAKKYNVSKTTVNIYNDTKNPLYLNKTVSTKENSIIEIGESVKDTKASEVFDLTEKSLMYEEYFDEMQKHGFDKETVLNALQETLIYKENNKSRYSKISEDGKRAVAKSVGISYNSYLLILNTFGEYFK